MVINLLISLTDTVAEVVFVESVIILVKLPLRTAMFSSYFSVNYSEILEAEIFFPRGKPFYKKKIPIYVLYLR